MFKLLPFDLFGKILDTKVYSMLLFFTETWGLNIVMKVDVVHQPVCKLVLGIKSSMSGHVVMGECGGHPLYIYTLVTYWC